MKNLVLLFSVFLISITVKGQEQKVEIVPLVEVTSNSPKVDLQIQLSCGTIGVTILRESIGLNNHYDLYNYLSKTPGVSINTSSSLNAKPTISMRGDNSTIVIVDGIRYDTSILNMLNPSDIESVIVAPSVAASNYLLNN